MKKFLSMAVVFSMAAALFTGCDKKTPSGEGEVNLKLGVASTEVAPASKLQFTVSSEVAPESDIVINVSSDKPEFATVPATVTLKAGDLSVSDFITGVAPGEATIKISAEGVKISVAEVKVTVKEGVVADPILSVSAPSKVELNQTVKYTVSSPTAAKSDIVVNVTSSNTANATVTSPVTLKAGQTSVQGEVTGVALGNATITIEAGSVALDKASVEVTVVEPGPVEYCVAEAMNGYSSVEYVKLGETKIDGGKEAYPPIFTGSIDIDGATLPYEVQYNREGIYGGATYDDDTFTIAIFADWTKSGKLTKVASHNIIDKQSKPTQLVSGTIDVPSDASAEGFIRVIQWFTGDRTESTINDNGCGYAESGGVFNITYTIK